MAAITGIAGGIGSAASGAFNAIGGMQGLGAISSIAGPFISAGGSAMQGGDLKEIGQRNAQIERMKKEAALQNAKFAEQNAKLARQNAAERAKVQAEKGRRLMASQKAGFAAGGVRVDVGAPLVIESDTKELVSKDIATTMRAGSQQARMFLNQAANQRYQAEMFELSANIAEDYGSTMGNSSIWDAVGSGVQGLGSLATIGSQMGWFSSAPRLAGNQSAIKAAGGLSNVANKVYTGWM